MCTSGVEKSEPRGEKSAAVRYFNKVNACIDFNKLKKKGGEPCTCRRKARLLGHMMNVVEIIFFYSRHLTRWQRKSLAFASLAIARFAKC
jgi:hypothetical protein